MRSGTAMILFGLAVGYAISHFHRTGRHNQAALALLLGLALWLVWAVHVLFIGE